MKGVNLKSLLCVAVMFCSVSVIAQPQGADGHRPQRGAKMDADPVEMAEKQTNRMAAELGLTEKQKKSLLELNKSLATDMKTQAELRRKEQEELEAKRKAERKAMVEKMDKHNLAVMSLLNDEQKLEYAKMLSKAQPRGGQMQQGGQRGGRAPQEEMPKRGMRPGQKAGDAKCETTTQE